MDEQQPVNVNNSGSLNDGDLRILKDEHDNGLHTFNKSALDDAAEELFFSLFEEHEGIIKAKHEIRRLERKLQGFRWKAKRIEEEIKYCCLYAKAWQERENFNGFVSERNVGVQYPPKNRYNSPKLL